MKKFNVYSKGKLISCETETEMFESIDTEVAESIQELSVGDRHIYTNPVSKREWEIERIV